MNSQAVKKTKATPVTNKKSYYQYIIILTILSSIILVITITMITIITVKIIPEQVTTATVVAELFKHKTPRLQFRNGAFQDGGFHGEVVRPQQPACK